MNALFVNACIREHSRTRALCEAYIRANWTNRDVYSKELALYNEPLAPLDRECLLQREKDIAAGDYTAQEYRYAMEFAEAEEILVGAPYWDCSFPALLKIYLERICVNGITFRYGTDGRPIKICAGRKLIVVTTAGGYLPQGSSLELYWKELCALLGIPELCFCKAEGLDIQGNDPQEILQRAMEGLGREREYGKKGIYAQSKTE